MLLDLPHSFNTEQGVVRYGKVGRGPSLVLVHGTPWSSFSYSEIIPRLTENFEVFYYDLIGYGQSEMRDGQKVSLDVQGEILTDLLKHWELKNPNIVAHDFGGAIALRAHLLHNVSFSKLLLMNVVAISPWGSPFFSHVQKHEAAFAGVPAYIHEAILRAYIGGALHGDLAPETIEKLLLPWLSDNGQSAFYRQIAQASQKYTDEIEPSYQDIDCPVCILWGDADEWIPIDTGRRLHASIPGSSFKEIPRAGHLVQLDQPDAVLKQIFAFMS